LCDGDLENRQVGTFSYNTESKQFAMTIFEKIKKTDLPLSLEGFANRKNTNCHTKMHYAGLEAAYAPLDVTTSEKY